MEPNKTLCGVCGGYNLELETRIRVPDSSV